MSVEGGTSGFHFLTMNSTISSSTAEKSKEHSTWDPNSFEQSTYNQAGWREQSKKATRVQDLALAMDDEDSHDAVASTQAHESSWPYESSPCRLFGRTSVEVSGENIFHTNFADNEMDSDIDSEDEGGLASYLPPKQ